MANSLYEGFGALDLPIAVAGTETSLTGLDPARTTLAALFTAAINAELGPIWTLAAAGSPLAGSSPVQDTLEMAPTGAIMKQRKAGWPLLCVYRDGSGVLEQATLNGQVEKLTQPWTVDYVIGPVDVANLRQLGDVFQAVVKTVRLCIRLRGHPAYLGGALQFFPAPVAPNPAVPLFPVASYIGAIELKSYDGPPLYQAKFAGGDDSLTYYAVSLHLETVEHSYDDLDAFPAVQAADILVRGGGSEGLVTDFVIASTDAPYQYP